MITLCPSVIHLLRSAILIKSGILLLILVFSFLPDHDADAFNPPSTPTSNYLDSVIRRLFQGFRKWDSIYFTFIAQWGYVYEQSLAFFPLVPLVLGLGGRFVQLLTAYVFSLETMILLIGLCLNFTINLINTLLLYRLTRQILYSPRLSFLAALLFCLNPASVFFSSLYSESLFFMLTCFGLIALDSGHPVYSSLSFALSTLCRSNGLINVGFLGFYSVHSFEFRNLLWNSKVLEESRKSMLFFLDHAIKWWFNVLRFILPRILLGLICISPYFIYEAFGYLVFCNPDPKNPIRPQLLPKPSHQVLNFGVESGFRIPSFLGNRNQSSGLIEIPMWCHQKLPFFYSAIQSEFWDVGLWRYYVWKQIPNFILACPVVLLVLSCSSTFYQRAPRACKTLGFRAESPLDRRLVPHVFHALFLCIYGVTHINVQVLTRMIFSSCPIVYWYCAYLLHSKLSPDSEYALNKLASVSTSSQAQRRPDNLKGFDRIRHLLDLVWLVINPWQYTRRRERWLLYYFFGYTLVGCLLHPNFYPWT